MQLRDYQLDMKSKIYDSWSRNQNVLSVLPTGAGKTALSASIFHDHKGAAVAIAHRKELVGQISVALGREGVVHGIIAPAATVKEICKLHLEKLGTVMMDQNSLVKVAGVASLKKAPAHWMNQVTLWMIDECFPAGTLVDGVPIESLKVGDKVTAFDDKTGRFDLKEIVYVFKNPMPSKLINIKIGHHVLTCTSGHPIWTKRGWINAENITSGDYLYTLWETDSERERSSTLQVKEIRKNILSKKLRNGSSRDAPKTKNSSNSSRCGMHHVWRSLRLEQTQVSKICENRESILQQGMFKQAPFNCVVRNNDQNEPEIRVGENDKKQPHEESRYTEKSVRNLKENKAFTESKRREWSTTNCCRTKVIGAVRRGRVQFASNSSDKIAGSRIAHPLQNRLRKSKIKNSDRSRRLKSWDIGEKGTRCTEGSIFNWQRVESVSILKSNDTDFPRGGKGGGCVYNIEVEDYNTYIANGVVVHNCHHIASKNTWFNAVNMFPNAKGLGVTATPCRSDGKGLGRHTDGVFDDLLVGPNMRDLINRGFLTDYRIFAPPSDLDVSSVETGRDGDFKKPQLKKAVQESHIVGDIVSHYIRIAKGKLGITFVSDVETAVDVSAQYNAMGIPSEVVDAKTPSRVRAEVLRRFERREILQLVNVDLFGEGFDLPAVEVISFGRPTQSYGLYVQQFGRCLRIMEGKTFGIIIDHVGNVVRHGLPDKERVWSLEAREKSPRMKNPEDDIPLRYCIECTQPYEKVLKICPHCGTPYVPASRSKPEYVDGDLFELSPEVLQQMRNEVSKIDEDPLQLRNRMEHAGASPIVVASATKNHRIRQETQQLLREKMAWWSAQHHMLGRSDDEIQRRFYHSFGVDILTAQSLGRPDAEKLMEKIK